MKILSLKRSVIFRWLVSYSLVLFLPMLIVVAVLFQTKAMMDDEVVDTNRFILDRTVDNIETNLSDIKHICAGLVMDNRINLLFSKRNFGDESWEYSIYKATQALNNRVATNKSTTKYFIYLNNSDMVLIPGAVYTQRVFYENYFMSDEYSFEEWQTDMKSYYNGQYKIVYYKNEKSLKRCVLYIRSIPLSSEDKVNANICAVIEIEDFVNGNTEGNVRNERDLLVIDREGNLVAGAEAISEEIVKKVLSDKNSQGNIYLNVGGEESVISYMTSTINGWRYIAVTPEHEYWGKSIHIKILIVLGLALSLVIGLLLEYYFIRMNYSPITEILKVLGVNKKDSRKTNTNEFAFITQAIHSTLNENAKIKTRVAQQNRELKSAFIRSLLKGRKTDLPIEELLNSYQITFKSANFTAMAIYIDEIDEVFWNDPPGKGTDPYSLIRFIITNVLEETISRKHAAFFTYDGDIISCLINVSKEENSDWKKDIKAALEEAEQFIVAQFKISILMGIGNLQKLVEGIPGCYQHALEALEYARVSAVEEFVFYEDIGASAKQSYYYPIEDEYKLINCLRSGDIPEARRILEHIFRENFAEGTLSPVVTRCLMFDIVGTLMKVESKMEISEKDREDQDNIVIELLKLSNVWDMKEGILKYMQKMSSTAKNTPSSRIKEMVVEYVEKHYADPDLTIVKIAEECNMNTNYLSRAFKEQAGEGLLNYINGYRITKAIELMKQEGMTQSRISELVGFTNVRTFQRAFKKFEGTSPGKFQIE